jgi:hypothetical protein
MLEGRQFIIFMDHRQLVGALCRVSEPWTARQQRHLSFISEFSTDIRHVSGDSNTVADTLSRPSLPPFATTAAITPAMPPPVDLRSLAAAQKDCPDCQQGKTSTALRALEVQIPTAAGVETILVDSSSCVLRPLVPGAFRKSVFDAIHSLVHPGIRAMRRLVSSRFVWPALAADITSWCRQCQHSTRPRSSPSRYRPPGSATYTWTWWGPCQLLRTARRTCSPPWTSPLAGWRRSRFNQPQRRRAWQPSLWPGSVDLVSQPTLQQTGADNLCQACGRQPCHSWASHTWQPQRTTPKVMTWSSEPTDVSRTPSKPGWPVWTGPIISHGYSWAYVQPHRKILGSPWSS